MKRFTLLKTNGRDVLSLRLSDFNSDFGSDTLSHDFLMERFAVFPPLLGNRKMDVSHIRQHILQGAVNPVAHSVLSFFVRTMTGQDSVFDREILNFFYENCVILDGYPGTYHKFLFCIYYYQLKANGVFYQASLNEVRFAEIASFPDFVSEGDCYDRGFHIYDLHGNLFPSAAKFIDYYWTVACELEWDMLFEMMDSFSFMAGPSSLQLDEAAGKIAGYDEDYYFSLYNELQDSLFEERRIYWSKFLGSEFAFEILFRRYSPIDLYIEHGGRPLHAWTDLIDMMYVLDLIHTRYYDQYIPFDSLRCDFEDVELRRIYYDKCTYLKPHINYSFDIVVSRLGLYYQDGYLYFIDGFTVDGICLGFWFECENNAFDDYSMHVDIGKYRVVIPECTEDCLICASDVPHLYAAIATETPCDEKNSLFIHSMFRKILDMYPEPLMADVYDQFTPAYFQTLRTNDCFAIHGRFDNFCSFNYIQNHQWRIARKRPWKPRFPVELNSKGKFYWKLLTNKDRYPCCAFFPYELVWKMFLLAFGEKHLVRGEFRQDRLLVPHHDE